MLQAEPSQILFYGLNVRMAIVHTECEHREVRAQPTTCTVCYLYLSAAARWRQNRRSRSSQNWTAVRR